MNSTRLVVCVNQRQGRKSCGGTGSRLLIEIIRKKINEAGLDIAVVEQVCLGHCIDGIAMRIAPGGPFFTQVTEDDIDSIIDAASQFSV